MNDVSPSFLTRRWPRFWALLGLFTILGLVDAGQFYIHVRNFRGNAIHWEEALAVGLGDWYLWAALSPIIFWLGQRFPISHANWKSRLLIHLYFACLVMLVKIALDLALYFAVIGKDVMFLALSPEERQLDNYEYLIPLYRSLVFAKFFIYLLVYGSIVGLSHFLAYYERFRERELRASRLETQLAQAQLQVLRMQLQPHFLFNTLNAIAALMHKDVRLADRMLARLGELLRATLEDPGAQEGTLRQELDFLRPYVEIEQARLGPRLSVTMDVPNDLLDARIPYLIAQPLVENAIRHGLAPRVGSVSLAIRARRQDDQLVIEVADNGVGLPPEGQSRDGIGLANTRARLRGLYGDDAALDLSTDPDGGTIATVTLPLRLDVAEPETPPPTPARSSGGRRTSDRADEVASAHR